MAKKVTYSIGNSEPYLSGDFFAKKADVSLYSRSHGKVSASVQSVAEARVIFCPSHDLERFLSDYKGKINARVLILGNSDRDFTNFDFAIPGSIKHVFAQNLLITERNVSCLPIGIENYRLGTNGLPSLFGEKYINVRKVENMLVGPFGTTHPDRIGVLESYEQIPGPWTVVPKRTTPKSYASISSKYRFILAPRGNGVDTHRFWESLYRGSIPVVQKSIWLENLRILNLPHLAVDTLMAGDFPKDQFKFVGEINPMKVESLWWPYWARSIRRYVA